MSIASSSCRVGADDVTAEMHQEDLTNIISSISADTEEMNEQDQQQQDLTHEFDRTCKILQATITEICAVGKVWNELLEHCTKSHPEWFRDCVFSDGAFLTFQNDIYSRWQEKLGYTGVSVNVCTTNDFPKLVDAVVLTIDLAEEATKIVFSHNDLDRNIKDGRTMLCLILPLTRTCFQRSPDLKVARLHLPALVLAPHCRMALADYIGCTRDACVLLLDALFFSWR